MFRKALLIAAWTAACLYFPQLAVLDPVVKPVIDKVPVKQVDFDTMSDPIPFYDGRHCPAEAVCEVGDCPLQAPQWTASELRPLWRVVSAPFRRDFWCAGPIRRFVSAPVRWLIRRC